MNIKCLSLAFVLITIPSLYVYAQDNNKDLLDSVQKKYKSVNDFSADFKQSLNVKGGITGKIYYSKGNKFRLELKNSIITSDGTTLWNYNKGQKKVVMNNVSVSDPSSFTLENFLFDYPSKSIVTREIENNRNILVLVPKDEKKMNFKQTKIWVNSDYLITQVIIENLSGTITNFQLSNYKLNQKLPDSIFSFSPPEGINIVDLRK